MSLIRVSFLALALLLSQWSPVLAGSDYYFDKQHSNIQVHYNHLGLANQTLRFLLFDGKIVFDAEKPEETIAEVTVKAASVTSLVDGFDEKLRGKGYFNAEQHPDIVFKSAKAQRTGHNSGTMSGDLTINGITKPVTFSVVYRYSGKHPLGGLIKKYKGLEVAGFGATAKLLRSDFGMGSYAPLVSDAVTIIFEMELLKKSDH